MAFKERTDRQSQYPDFRVGFVAFEGSLARISVGTKEPQNYVQNIISSNPSSISPWNTFYSNLSNIGDGITLGNLGLAKTFSEYFPVHTDDPNFNILQSFPPIGGEFLVEVGKTIIFWIQVPVRSSGGVVLIGVNFDPIQAGKRLKIGFGASLPENTEPDEFGNYFFYIPIFKIKVTQTNIDLLNYDLGECVFLSPEFDSTPGVSFEFSEASSYYD